MNPELDFPLAHKGAMSTRLLALGITRFAQLAAMVQTLPYGRVSTPHDMFAVMAEQRGTCSAKHRVLAAAAHEAGKTTVQLTVGIYEMSEHNTPGVGPVLQTAGLHSIPEAHCYLTYEGQRYDYTGLAAGNTSPFNALLSEHAVEPIEMPSIKETLHREALARWAKIRNLEPGHAWMVREWCIQALAADLTINGNVSRAMHLLP
jgi:hypothetical protein